MFSILKCKLPPCFKFIIQYRVERWLRDLLAIQRIKFHFGSVLRRLSRDPRLAIWVVFSILIVFEGNQFNFHRTRLDNKWMSFVTEWRFFNKIKKLPLNMDEFPLSQSFLFSTLVEFFYFVEKCLRIFDIVELNQSCAGSAF